MKALYTLLLLTLVSLNLSCSGEDATSTANNQEMGQQVGDIMAAVDESGGSDGSYALLEGSRKTFARYNVPIQSPTSSLGELFLPKAEAASCTLAGTFGSCISSSITRTFNSCTLFGATFNGNVVFNFTGGDCLLDSDAESVSRSPNFSVTGLRGFSLSVEKTGSVGQRITRVNSGSFLFSNDGIRRVITSGGGSTLSDFTTTTTSNIGISGASRNGRVLNSGTLRISNNSTGNSCDISPVNVTWESSCNCATSGRWTGTCTDDESFNLTISSCGEASLTIGDRSQSISFDRCYSI